MFGNHTQKKPQTIGFLLLPHFSMIAFTSCIEPLRAANRMNEGNLYQWKTYSVDGDKVAASNGVSITTDAAFTDTIDADVDVLFVCAGLQARDYRNSSMTAKLQAYARAGVPLGGVCTGSIALANAGLLDKCRCTIHWENIEGFVEVYPGLDVTATLFEIDGDRYTCSGGTAPLDMMIYSIAKDHGKPLAASVAEQMLHSPVRQPHDHQRTSIQYRTGISHPKLLAAIAYMEAYIETPLGLPEFAKRLNISLRQLERLFRSLLGTTPSRYYLALRLQRARQLLTQTTMSILQIAVATGFKSAAHFTQAYKNHFTYPPRTERLNAIN